MFWAELFPIVCPTIGEADLELKRIFPTIGSTIVSVVGTAPLVPIRVLAIVSVVYVAYIGHGVHPYFSWPLYGRGILGS